MAPFTVKIKHAGKTLDLQLDPDQPATVFKDAVYQVTGVPQDRMKVMIKGGVLKVSTFVLRLVRFSHPGNIFRMIPIGTKSVLKRHAYILLVYAKPPLNCDLTLRAKHSWLSVQQASCQNPHHSLLFF